MAARLLAPGVAAAALLSFAPLAAGQALVLPRDGTLWRELEQLETFQRKGRWDRAIRGLDRLLATGGGKLLADRGRGVTVRAEARRRLLALPQAGQRFYDLIHDGPAEALFAAARRTPDVKPLVKLLALHPASRRAPLARKLLVARCLERGQLGLASRYATRAERRTIAALRARVPSRPRALPSEMRLAWRRETPGYYTRGWEYQRVASHRRLDWTRVRQRQAMPASIPRFDGRRLYVQDGSHALAIDLWSGKIAWRVNLVLGRDHFVPPPVGTVCRLALGAETVVCLLPDGRGLVGVDRARGTVRWRRSLSDLDRMPDSARIHAVDVLGGVALATVSTAAPAPSVYVVGFEPDTGQRRWTVFVAGRDKGPQPWPAVAKGAGTLFVLTGVGVVAAVDTRGEIVWLRRYRSLRDSPEASAWLDLAIRKSWLDPGVFRSSLQVAGRSLWGAPADADGYFAWSARTGRQWAFHGGGSRAGRSFQPGRILGARGGRVVVAAPNGALRRLGMRRARPVSSFSEMLRSPRSVIAGRQALVPARGAVIGVDLASGEQRRVLKGTTGHLYLAGGRLIVVRPHGIEAYGVPVVRRARRRASTRTLIRRLGSVSYALRQAAQQELLSRGAKRRDRRALARATDHRDPEVRLRVRQLRGTLRRRALRAKLEPRIKASWRRWVRGLLAGLLHPNPGVRVRTIRQVEKRILDPEALSLVRPLLRARDGRVSLAAAATLLGRGDRSGLKRLERALRFGSLGRRLTVVHLLAKARGDARLLARALEDRHARVRRAAAKALIDQGAVEHLARVRVRPGDLRGLVDRKRR